jgi:hypothetical protein
MADNAGATVKLDELRELREKATRPPQTDIEAIEYHEANKRLIWLAPNLARLVEELVPFVEAACDEHACAASGFAIDENVGLCAAHLALASLAELGER